MTEAQQAPPDGSTQNAAGREGSPGGSGHTGGPRWERFEDLVGNVMLARSELVKQFLDPRRDIEEECGYPSSMISGTIAPSVYQRLYDREAIATRVVEVLPRESWQVQPVVYEDESAEVLTPFEVAWEEIGLHLRGEQSYYRALSQEGSPVWEYLRRLDELSGIGQYGVMLLGIDDGIELHLPANGDNTFDTVGMYSAGMDPSAPYAQVTPSSGTDAQYYDFFPRLTSNPPRNAPKKKRKLLFVRVFPESLVQVTQFESNVRSPRFGQPVMYLITFNDPREGQNTGVGLPLASVQVHWTRVLHVADNLGSSEVFGVPRMRPVLNRLLDLQKLYGGSAEMYWRGAFPGLSIETHPQLGAEVDIDITHTRQMMEDYMNGLQRYLSLMGMSAKSLAPQVVDPSPQIRVQVEAICIKLGIPIRVFMGSERGELASSQDDAAWNDRLRDRERMYITPRIIVPFVDRLIYLGVLPAPPRYHVWWPDLTSQSEQERASIAVSKTQAMVQYQQGGIQDLITPMDYLTRVMRMSESEALSVIRNAEEAKKAREEEQLARRASLLKKSRLYPGAAVGAPGPNGDGSAAAEARGDGHNGDGAPGPGAGGNIPNGAPVQPARKGGP